MSKEVDLEKPLSDEDRAYLKQRSRNYDIEENDRVHGNGDFAEPEDDTPEPVFAPVPTVAAAPITPGSAADKPPQFVGTRPYGVDRAVWEGSTGLSEQEGYASTSGEPHTEQQELDLGGDPDAGEGNSQEEPTDNIDDLNVEELKAELKARELTVSGDKQELRDRLRDALNKEEEEK